jgi:hypothetical protein
MKSGWSATCALVEESCFGQRRTYGQVCAGNPRFQGAALALLWRCSGVGLGGTPLLLSRLAQAPRAAKRLCALSRLEGTYQGTRSACVPLEIIEESRGTHVSLYSAAQRPAWLRPPHSDPGRRFPTVSMLPGTDGRPLAGHCFNVPRCAQPSNITFPSKRRRKQARVKPVPSSLPPPRCTSLA